MELKPYMEYLTVVIRLSPHFFKSAFCRAKNVDQHIRKCLLWSCKSKIKNRHLPTSINVTLYLFKEMSSIGLSLQHSDKSALGHPDQGADLTEWLLYVFGAIDRSHILIIAPWNDPTFYYCKKYIYFALLQGVVDAKWKFWDYDFGWVGRNQKIEHCFKKLKLVKGQWVDHFYLTNW
jgi:hypothetical protein